MFTASRGLYGTIWRWHFYAGLLVAPFLIILSLTGAIYLFNTEINDALYPELSFASSDASALPPSELIGAAEQAFPGGVVTRIDMPAAPGRSAQLFVTTAAGEALRVFVDPPTAKVLGSYVYTKTLVGFADVMHGSLMLGDVGDAVVELAACWTFILVCSGIYLWFPRGGWRSATWIPRLRLRGRLLWRDFHQIAGLYSAILLLFLIISGLPWATIWGGRVLTPLSNIAGLGYPEGARRPLQSTGLRLRKSSAKSRGRCGKRRCPLPTLPSHAGPFAAANSVHVPERNRSASMRRHVSSRRWEWRMRIA